MISRKLSWNVETLKFDHHANLSRGFSLSDSSRSIKKSRGFLLSDSSRSMKKSLAETDAPMKSKIIIFEETMVKD